MGTNEPPKPTIVFAGNFGASQITCLLYTIVKAPRVESHWAVVVPSARTLANDHTILPSGMFPLINFKLPFVSKTRQYPSDLTY